MANFEAWRHRVGLLPYDEAVAIKWGELHGNAHLRGRPRPDNDSWIAACCLVNGLPLATFNTKDFADYTEHDGLRLIGTESQLTDIARVERRITSQTRLVQVVRTCPLAQPSGALQADAVHANPEPSRVVVSIRVSTIGRHSNSSAWRVRWQADPNRKERSD